MLFAIQREKKAVHTNIDLYLGRKNFGNQQMLFFWSVQICTWKWKVHTIYYLCTKKDFEKKLVKSLNNGHTKNILIGS